jgi:hypothetical protein
MKKVIMMMLGATLLISSCGTYEATGAFTGAQFGSIIGSAIGGITGGWRGSDIGTLVGMAGGAAVGAAVGRAADERSQRQYEEHVYQREQRRQAAAAAERQYDDSGFDPAGRGDDRIEMTTDYAATTNDYSATYAGSECLEIRNPRLVDHTHDNLLTRGEEARMVFEIYNRSSKPVYRVLPSVTEVSGNKHIHISENVLIESILPYQTLRYTAMVKADNKVKDGEAVIRITVFQGNAELSSQRKTFTLRTSR